MATEYEEMGLIGLVLEQGTEMVDLLRRYELSPEHIQNVHVRRAYKAMLDLRNAGKEVTVQTLREQFEEEDWFERAGGVTWLGRCLDSAVMASSVDSLTAGMARSARQREYIARLKVEITAAEKSPSAIPRLHAELVTDLERVASGGTKTDIPHIRTYAETFKRRMDARIEGEAVGLQTPWHALNETIGGIESGQMVVVAAPQKVGKTAFACKLLHQWAVRERRPCLMFSLEMSGQEVFGILAKVHTGYDFARMRRGMSQTQYDAFVDARETIEASPIMIDTETRTIEDIVETARALVPQHGIECVCVDYLQLAATKRPGNWYEKVAHASQALKLSVGKALDVPVIVLSQITRGQDGEVKGMRHGQELEQACDKLILLSQLDQYQGLQSDPEPLNAPRRVHVAYNRQGPTDLTMMMFDKTSYRWSVGMGPDVGDY